MKKILLTALLLCLIVTGVMSNNSQVVTYTDIPIDLCQGEKLQINDTIIETTGIYYVTLTNIQGDDSILRYIVNFHPTYDIYDTTEICQGDSLYFCNGYVKSAGDYICNYQSVHGCDSVRHLHLIVNPVTITILDTTLCANGFYFHEQYYTESGTYDYVIKKPSTCDEIHRLILHLNKPAYTIVNIDVCDGDSVEINGKNVLGRGTYDVTMHTKADCDSVIHYVFNVHNRYDFYDTVSVCANESITYQGRQVSSAGDHVFAYKTVTQCDSVYHLHVIKHPTYLFSIDTTVCERTFDFHGRTYTTEGVYYDSLTTVRYGCDSVYQLTLHFAEKSLTTLHVDVCEGSTYVIHGRTIAATGTYYDTLVNEANCDSIVRYIFNVHNHYNYYDTANICNGTTYEYHGESYSATGDYEKRYKTVNNCDSIFHLHLTVNYQYHLAIYEEICANDDVIIDGQRIDTSGVYTQTFKSKQGCDSVVDWHITVNQPTYRDISIDVCDGETYFIHGVEVPATGTYYDTLVNKANCDSIVRYIFNVHPKHDIHDTMTICQGDSVLYCGEYYHTAGVFTHQYQSAINGCDSVRHLHLTVNPTYLFSTDTTLCATQFLFDGRVHTESGHYEYKYTTATGCDSIYVLNLTLHKPVTVEIPYDACDGDSAYINGIWVQASGIYEYKRFTVHGCDSIIRYVFNVHNRFEQFDSATICKGDTFHFHGESFTAQGNYIVNFRTAHGCDSIYNLHLTVNESYLTEDSITLCGDSYQFFERRLTSSGTYDKVFQAVTGCDSVFRLHLTLYKPVTVDVPYDACYGDSAYINGKHIPATGVYVDSNFTVHGCDSIVRYIFNVHNSFEQYDTASICQGESYDFHGQTVNLDGDYVQYFQTVHQCDSIYHLHLTVNNNYFTTIDTSICINDRFAIEGIQIQTSGTYTESHKTIHGCDSTIEWHVTVNQPTTVVQSINVCQGETYNIRGKVIPAIGNYYDTLVNSKGCDSIVHYIFNVHQTYDIYDTMTICEGDSALFCYNYYHTPGDYTKTYKSVVNGCDSVHHLHLIVNRSYLFMIDTTVCAHVFNFFNQALTQSGVYEQAYKTTAGCDSIYRIDLKLYHPIQVDIPYDACDGDSATINGVTIPATGIYVDSFKTSHGCDSIVRYIFNVHNRFELFDTVAICQGDSFLFQGRYVSAAGNYEERYTTVSGCDSIYHLHLDINPSYLFLRDTVICSNSGFSLNGQPVQTSGTYYERYTTPQACDSIIEWHITVYNPSVVTRYIEACQGQTFTIRDKVIPAIGNYFDTLENSVGCDSIVHYIFNVHPTFDLYDTIRICEGDSALFCGTYVSNAGDYTRQYQTVNECDSVRHLHLIVNPSYLFESDTTVCGYGFYFFNRTLTQSGTYDEVFHTAEGCDSIYRIHLTLNNHTFNDIHVNTCEGSTYNVRGKLIPATGTYYDTLMNSVGCDSIVRYIFNVNPTYDIYDTLDVCEGDSVLYCGEYFSTAGDYTRKFQSVNSQCDSTHHLHLIVYPTYRFVTDTALCATEFYFHNHSLTESGTYTYSHLTVNGCDSVYILNLELYKPVTIDVSYDVCNGDSALISGKYVPATGIYVDSLLTPHGCDSIVRYIFNVHNRFEQFDSATICEEDSFLFQGRYVTAAGDYTETYKTAYNCDSIYHLHLTVNPTYRFVTDTALCGTEFYFHNHSLTESGTYTYNHKTVKGCDSVYIINLTLYKPVVIDVPYDACVGDSALINGRHVPATGVFVDSLLTSHGCDSIVRYIFNVHSNFVHYDTASICDGEIYNFHGDSITIAGDYIKRGQTVHGCDSSYYLHLTVNLNYSITKDTFICANDGFTLNGQQILKTGAYYESYKTIHGCDSTILWNITVGQPSFHDIHVNSCQGTSYNVRGKLIPATGTYYDTLLNTKGCDSIVRYIFNVFPSYDIYDTVSVCQGDSIQFGGKYISTSGDYTIQLTTQDHGCDSTVHLHLTVKPTYRFVTDTALCGTEFYFHNQSLTESGTYTYNHLTVDGCDSVYILNLELYKPVTIDVSYDACDGDSAIINGHHVPATGVFVDSLLTSHGCDSIVRYVFNVHSRFEQYDTASICYGDTLYFHGQNYTASGDYTVKFQTLHYSCDSIYHLHLTVNPTYRTVIDTLVCSNHYFALDGQQITTSGTYPLTYTTVNGCDSIIIYNVTIEQVQIIYTSASICEGDFYIFRGDTLTTTGIFDDTLKTQNGCDLIYRMNLTVNPTYLIVEADRDICQTDLPVYWQNKPITTSGVYYANYTTVAGCDSTITTRFIVHPNEHNYDSVINCSGTPYLWEDTVITTPGDYTRRYYTTFGCDSFMHLHYDTVAPRITINETICEGDYYEFRGHRYNQEGTYVHLFRDSMMCDTVYTINLTIDTTGGVTEQTLRLCNQTMLDYRGHIYTQSGIYYDTLLTATGCLKITKLNLTLGRDSVFNQFFNICEGTSAEFRGHTYTTSGVYYDTAYTSEGCTKAYIITVNVNPVVTLDYPTLHVCMPTDSIIFDGKYYKPGIYTFASNSSVAPCDPHHRLTVVSDYFFHDTTVTVCAYNLPYINPYTGRQYRTEGVYFENYTTSYLGCDSIYRIDLRVNKTPRLETYDTVYNCSGSPYLWRRRDTTPSSSDTVLVTPGNYTYTLTSVGGCDSVSHLRYDTTAPRTRTISVALCQGDNFFFRGQVYNVSGQYTVRRQNSLGCDTTYIIDLTVDTTASYREYTYADCNVTRYVFQGKTYTHSGIYFDTTYSATGCPHVTKLNLTLGHDPVDTIINICEGQSITFRNRTYTLTGNYNDTLIAKDGCPIYYNIHVNVNPAFTIDLGKYAVCGRNDSALVRGKWYKPGVHNYFEQSPNDSCPTKYHLEVINYEAYHDTTVNICHNSLPFVHPYTHRSYNAHGIYHDTLNNSGPTNCPTYYTLTLNVINDHDSHTYADTLHNCSGTPYVWRGLTLSSDTDVSVTYRDRYGCDSTFTLHYVTTEPRYTITDTICQGDYLDFRGRRFNQQGTYTLRVPAVGTVYGSGLLQCDTIFTINLALDTTGYYREDTIYCCNQTRYNYNGTILTHSGIYFDTLYSAHGCLQVTKLDLKLGKDTMMDTILTICEGECATFRNTTYCQSGVYQDFELTIEGCTLTYNIIVNVKPVYRIDTTMYVCGSTEPVMFKGTPYLPGVHCFNDPDDHSQCPSTYCLTVIDESAVQSNTVTACDYYDDPNTGRRYTETGVYHEVFYSPHGCPVPYTLDLTINHTIQNTVYDTVCKGDYYAANGVGLYPMAAIDTTITYTRSGGLCDSIVTLHLAVVDQFDTTFATICQGDVYTWYVNQEDYYTSCVDRVQGRTYSTGCVQWHILILTVTQPIYVTKISIDPVCADDATFNINASFGATKPRTYSIRFDNNAILQGFESPQPNNTYDPSSVMQGRMPDNKTGDKYWYARPDLYTVSVEFDDGVCGTQANKSATLEVRYPSYVLEQNWNDVVAILRDNQHNGDPYTFSWIEWFVDGQSVSSGTLTYLYEEGVDLTDHVVSARLTRSGESNGIMTCELPVTRKTDSQTYPTIDLSRSVVKTSQAPQTSFTAEEPGQYYLYSTTGQLIHCAKFEADNEVQVTLPAVQGYYLLRVITEHTSETFKVLVQ